MKPMFSLLLYVRGYKAISKLAHKCNSPLPKDQINTYE